MASKRVSRPTEKAQALHERQRQSLKRKTNDTTITSQIKRTRVQSSSTERQATLDSTSGDADTTPWLTDHESAMESRPPTEHESQDHSEVDENEGKAETSEAELGGATELSHFISELTSFQSA